MEKKYGNCHLTNILSPKVRYSLVIIHIVQKNQKSENPKKTRLFLRRNAETHVICHLTLAPPPSQKLKIYAHRTEFRDKANCHLVLAPTPKDCHLPGVPLMAFTEKRRLPSELKRKTCAKNILYYETHYKLIEIPSVQILLRPERAFLDLILT